MKVLVTGANGFIGRNLCARLEQEDGIKLLKLDRQNWTKDLGQYVDQADFIFHLAGVNRPENDSEFNSGNLGLTEQLVKELTERQQTKPVVLSSSVQAELDNPYGKSKLSAEAVLLTWARDKKANVKIYRLPNVFGKWCKPNYNSVVATFCYNIVNGLEIQINDPTTKLSLVYIDDVVDEFMRLLRSNVPTTSRGKIPRHFDMTLQQLADKIYAFKRSRDSLVIPDFEEAIDRFLYATYTSYLPTDGFGYALEMQTDPRGWLAEFIKSKQAGQIFISRTKPGITRGNHWHHTKIEKFLVVSGQAEINFRQINSKDRLSYKVSGDKLKVVDIPAGYAHSITNVGKSDLITIFWADEIFDSKAPDTYYTEV